MTFKLKLLRGRKGKEKGGQCSIKVRATFFFFPGMRLQRWSKKKKKSNNRGKRYSAAEARSGSEHVGSASAVCWRQNVKRKLMKEKGGKEGRREVRKENGRTSLERGKWSSAEAFIVPEVQ